MAKKLKKIANPAPLGLAAFGMTTILLNLHNLGFFDLGAMILAMGLFYGGIAQVIAGVLEFKNGNTFGFTAFTSYGFFWISLIFILIAPGTGLVEAPSAAAMGSYLLVWGLFTLIMFFATLKLNRVIQFVFGSLVLLFVLLALADFTGIALIKTIAGIVGIICGLSAIYLDMAELLNKSKVKATLPIWPVKK